MTPPADLAYAALMASPGNTAVSLDDLTGGPRWHADALCREYPSVNFFPVPSPRREAAAKSICARCLVRAECTADALADPTRHGIWSGTTAGERARLRGGAARSRPACVDCGGPCTQDTVPSLLRASGA